MWRLLLALIILFAIYKLPLQGDIPDEMIQKAKEIDGMSKNKLELVKNTYLFVNNSYESPIRQYLKEPNKIFVKDIKTIWNSRMSYIPSNTQNEIFKNMLISTNKFEERDFIYRQSFCQISPHEYYILNIENQTYFIDLWSADHNGMFGCFSPPPCDEGVIICP